MKLRYALLLSLLPFTLSAQGGSFQLTVPAVNLSGPANVTLSGHASIQNIGSGLVDLTVVRVLNDTITGHNSFYCWSGACFPSSTAQAPFNLPFNPGETDTTLEAKLDPRGVPGNSRVGYCFYDASNPSDSVCVTYNYNFTPVGIDELDRNIFLSSPSPNPADRLSSITYSGTSGNARLMVTNLLGSLIKEIPLRDRQGAVVLATGELGNGIYLCTLWSEGRPTVSKRLIVSHK